LADPLLSFSCNPWYRRAREANLPLHRQYRAYVETQRTQANAPLETQRLRCLEESPRSWIFRDDPLFFHGQWWQRYRAVGS